MKIRIAYLLLPILAIALVGYASTKAASEKDSPVRHVVVFKYKEDATPEQVQKVTDAFRNLKDQIPGILSFEHGKNTSPEKLDQGFTNVYLLTFENAKARDEYLPHPKHKEFGKILGESGILEGVFVVDYQPQE